jgi:hypothetical protein
MLQRFDGKAQLQINVQRLLGRSLKAFGVTRGLFKTNVTYKKSTFAIRVIRLTVGSDVAVITCPIPLGAPIATLEKMSQRKFLEAVLLGVGVQVDTTSIVDGVVTLVSSSQTTLKSAPDYWISCTASPKSFILAQEVFTDITLRIAIERELLTWATSPAKFPFSLLRAPLGGYLLRRWPVQLLSDRNMHTQKIQDARESFNLPMVRKEVLDRARSWWVLSASLLAMAGLVLGFMK